MGRERFDFPLLCELDSSCRDKCGGIKMKAMAIIGVVISSVFIIGVMAIMLSNEPSELDPGMVLAGSFYWLAFSIVVLLAISKKRKTQ